MSIFKKYRDMYWPKPSYLIIGKNMSTDKSASWIELFLDLSFVIAIAILSQVLISSNNLPTLIGFSVGFMLLFIVWRSSTFYNQSYYTNTLRNRLVVFGHILCALMLVVFTNTSSSLYTTPFITSTFPYMVTSILVNCYLSYIWWSSGRHLYQITHQHDLYSLRSYYWGWVNGLSAFALFLLTVYHYFFYAYTELFLLYIFSFIIVCQFLTPLFQQRVIQHFLTKEQKKHGAKSVYATQHIDAGHTLERFGLFILLIIGEMFLGIVTAIKQPGVLNFETFVIFFCLLVIIVGIFWIYFDQVLSNTFHDKYLGWWTVMQFFLALTLLYLASFNREVILDFHHYFYYIHGSYLGFFVLLIVVSLFLDYSAEGSRLEIKTDLRHAAYKLKLLRIATVIILSGMFFIPFTSPLVYTLTILVIFVIHAFYGKKWYLESYDQHKQKK